MCVSSGVRSHDKWMLSDRLGVFNTFITSFITKYMSRCGLYFACVASYLSHQFSKINERKNGPDPLENAISFIFIGITFTNHFDDSIEHHFTDAKLMLLWFFPHSLLFVLAQNSWLSLVSDEINLSGNINKYV